MTDQLPALLKICEAATPGPWYCVEDAYVGYLGQSFFRVTGPRDVDGDNVHIAAGRIELEDAVFSSTFNPAKVRELLEDYRAMHETLCRIKNLSQDKFAWPAAEKCLDSLSKTVTLGDDNE